MISRKLPFLSFTALFLAQVSYAVMDQVTPPTAFITIDKQQT